MDYKYLQALPENLREFTWEGRPMIPVPNEENRELAQVVAEREKKFQDFRNKIEEGTKLNDLLLSHVSNIIREINSLRQIIDVRKDECEAGEHVKKLLNRETSRVEEQKQAIKKETTSISQRQEHGKKAIEEEEKRKKKIEDELKVDHQSIIKWLNDASITEDNIEVLQKCKFRNNVRVKEIDVQVSCATNEVNRWKELANQRHLEILTMQAQADRLADDFTRAYQQRQTVIAQLESTIEKIEKKELYISKLVDELNLVRESEKVVLKEIEENKRFLVDYKKQNNELNEDITSYTTKRANLLYDSINIQNGIDRAWSELQAQRGTASSLTMKISTATVRKKQLTKDIEEYEKRLKQLEEERSSLHESINQWKKQTLSEAEQFRQLEIMLHQAEVKYNRIHQHAVQILGVKAKAMEELKQCDLLQKQIENDMRNARLDIKHFRSTKLVLDKKMFQQHEEWCQLDSTILKLEQRVKRMKGNAKKDDELVELQNEIAKLMKLREERRANLNFMNSHLASNRDEICRMRKRMEKAKTQKEFLCGKLQETKVIWAVGQGELRKIINSKEECTADECVLKVKLKQLHAILERKSSDVFNLQRYKDKFESDIKKQIKDHQAKKDVLTYENKQAEEMRRNTQGKLNDLKNGIANKEAKYQNILGALGLGEKAGKEEVDLIINIEKEKAIARDRIDEWTEKLEIVKKNVTALRNTKSLMLATNRIYEVFLSRTEEEKTLLIRDMEIERDEVLQVRLERMEDKAHEISEDITNFKLVVQKLTETSSRLQDEFDSKQQSVENMKKELSEHEKMLRRADRNNEKIIQQSKKTNPTALVEETQIRSLRELLKQIYDIFSKICYQKPDAIERMEDLFARANLPPFSKMQVVRSRFRSSSSLSSKSSSTKSSSSKRQSIERTLARPSVVMLGEVDFK